MLSVFLEIRFSSLSPSVVLPTSITRLWVKALWFRQNVGRRKWRRVSHVTLDGHMCSHRRWLFPLQPFSLRCSLIWPTDCSLPKSDARILSHCYCTPTATAHPREHVKSGTRTVDTYVPFSGYVALCPKFTAFVLFYGFFMGPFFGHHPQCQR